MKNKKKFNFRELVNLNVQKQKETRSNYGYLKLPRGVKIFKEDPGSRVKIDILPYVVTANNHPDKDDASGMAVQGALWYRRPFKIHRSVGAKNDTIVCPTSVGKRCPICDYRAKRLKEGADKSETDAMRPSSRNMYVISPLDSKKYEKGIYVWDISYKCFEELLQKELDEDPSNGDFPSLDEGKTLSIRFGSSTIGKGKPFAEADKIVFEDRRKQYTDEILEDVPSLDDLLNILPASEIEAKFFELDDEPIDDEKEDEDDEEPEDEPEEKPARHAPTHKRRVEKEEEPEDDDDEDEDEDEPEEKPIRRKRAEPEKPTAPVRKNVKKQPEPEEDEEDEDEPEEEEKPIRKKKHDVPAKPEVKKGGKNKCPFGHVFGKDCEKFDDCDECAKWDDCVEESEK